MDDNSKTRFSEFLKKRKYSENTIKVYIKELDQIDIIDTDSRDDFASFIDLTVNKALKDSLANYRLHNLRAGLNQLFLMKYSISMKQFREEQKNSCVKSDLELILDDFFNYSTKFKSQNSNTAKSEKSHIRTFLTYIGYKTNFDFTTITVDDITDYTNSVFSSLKNSSKGRYLTSIRNFFRYLEYKNINFSHSILELPLTVANWKGRMVPVVLSKDEQKRIKEHFHTNDESSIRNNLIVSFMLDLGLRSSEIPDIKIKDIYWSSKVLKVCNTKTGNDRCIPLSNQLLSSLEEYLLNFRMNKSLYLFTSVNPRRSGSKMTKDEVRGLIRRAFEKEDIKGYWKGTHALRRTAASNLFNSTNSFKVVSDILGHESIDSTTSYVKVDFDLLRTIVSPLPGGKFDE